MKLENIISAIEAIAHPSLQESYDNSGLITGNPGMIIRKALLTLDCTEEVVQEAHETGCDLIIAHHPIIFKGLKRLTGEDYVQRTIISAVRKGIAIYACHTNLDNVLHQGVNMKIAEKLGLRNCRILSPLAGKLVKLVVFVPQSHADVVRNAMFGAGAGQIGNYDECSFHVSGTGTFRPGNAARPYLGEKGLREEAEELRMEVILPEYSASAVLNAVKKVHPYEEVAYDLYPLLNKWQEAGSGIIGELETEMEGQHFPAWLKKKMNAEVIRFTKPVEKVRTVAVCGGSGSFLIGQAKRSGADAYITGDVKYHEFFDAENRLMICDPGHFETEQYTIEVFAEVLSEKIPNFATIFAKTITNPVQYYY